MDLSCLILGAIWAWILYDAYKCIRIGNRRKRQRRREHKLLLTIRDHIRGTTDRTEQARKAKEDANDLT